MHARLARRRLDFAGRAAENLEQIGFVGLLHACAGPDQVDQRNPDENRKAAQHHGEGDGLQADAAEPAHIAQLGHPQHQRREDQRNDNHEDQAQKNLAGRVGDRADEVLQSLRGTPHPVGYQAGGGAGQHPVENLLVQRNPAHLSHGAVS